MKVFGVWYGGPSYSVGDPEEFSSIKQAKDVFWARSDGWDPMTSCGTPCVDESSMFLYGEDPEEAADAYPFAELVFGPRGGVRQVPC